MTDVFSAARYLFELNSIADLASVCETLKKLVAFTLCHHKTKTYEGLVFTPKTPLFVIDPRLVHLKVAQLTHPALVTEFRSSIEWNRVREQLDFPRRARLQTDAYLSLITVDNLSVLRERHTVQRRITGPEFPTPRGVLLDSNTVAALLCSI